MKKQPTSISRARAKEARWGFLFALPVILGFIIFVFTPLVVSAVMSLTDYNVMASATTFLGLANYAKLFSGSDIFFYPSLKVTCLYVLLSVPLQIIVALFLALLLNSNIKGRSIFRTIYYLPTIVPLVASSIVWMMLFDPDSGALNAILRFLGLPTSRWIWSEQMAIPSLALMSIWTVGGTVVIFLAGLQDVPAELYEAVDIDGGNAFHKFTKITLPMISPTIFFNFIMSFIASFQVFGQAFIMTKGGPNNATLMYVYYMYREAFQYGNIGYASAIGWVLFLIILLLTLLVFRSSEAWVFYRGEKG